jgi:hypothetical protein
VYFHKKSGKYYMQFTRGGKQYGSPYSMDMDFLAQWRADKEAELDAEGVPATRVRKECPGPVQRVWKTGRLIHNVPTTGRL